MELAAEVVFDLNGDLIMFQGGIGSGEVFGDLGKSEVQFCVAGIKGDGGGGAIEGFSEGLVFLFGL